MYRHVLQHFQAEVQTVLGTWISYVQQYTRELCSRPVEFKLFRLRTPDVIYLQLRTPKVVAV
jgi:hypothetical protein